MDVHLDSVEVRVLGALIEKQITTPEYYPLTLNSLVNACNQSTNREPVTTYDEGTVARAVEGLRQKGLTWVVTNSRAHKYGNRFGEKLALAKPQVAVMCVLMLRGPQTAGEVRGRTGRLHEFANLEEVDAVFESLAGTDPPFVTKLPRLPGTKESRYTQLLGGLGTAGGGGEASPREESPRPGAPVAEAPADSERVTRLELEIAVLREELEELRRAFTELKEQLE